MSSYCCHKGGCYNLSKYANHKNRLLESLSTPLIPKTGQINIQEGNKHGECEHHLVRYLPFVAFTRHLKQESIS